MNISHHANLQYHAGQYHYKDCRFPEVDEAVCNCPKNLKPEKEFQYSNEVEIEYAIISWLNANGCFAWKVNVKGFYDTNKGFFRKSNHIYELKGQSDIMCVLPDGRFMAIEVKTMKEKEYVMKHFDELRELRGVCTNKRNCHLYDQIVFLESIEKRNGVACFACCIEDVEYVLKDEGYTI